MAWDEWEQLKAEAAGQQAGQMQLNQAPSDKGTPKEDGAGLLKVTQTDLAKVGDNAFTLYNLLWDKGRDAVPSSHKAASDLSRQGFALGDGLQHVAKRWEEQLKSLRDACAHISNHMEFAKKVHRGDDDYIHGRLSSISTLDSGFGERAGDPGEKNPVYGESSKKKDN